MSGLTNASLANRLSGGSFKPVSPIKFLKDQLGLEQPELPAAPKPVEMPTMDSETIKQARRRAAARMLATSQGRESTMLSGGTPQRTTLGGA